MSTFWCQHSGVYFLVSTFWCQHLVSSSCVSICVIIWCCGWKKNGNKMDKENGSALWNWVYYLVIMKKKKRKRKKRKRKWKIKRFVQLVGLKEMLINLFQKQEEQDWKHVFVVVRWNSFKGVRWKKEREIKKMKNWKSNF